jgi:hypothetical protein
MTNHVSFRGRCFGAAALALFVVGAPVLAVADYQTMNDDALRNAVSGKTVRLETAIGAIPINFKADGTMVGRSQDLANYLGRSYDNGTWWIDSNQLCQKWKMWMDAKPYCFTLRQNGEKVQWTRSDGLKGTITVSN